MWGMIVSDLNLPMWSGGITHKIYCRQAGSCSHLSGIVRPTNESSSDCPIHYAGLMGHDPIGVNLPRTVRGRMLSYFHHSGLGVLYFSQRMQIRAPRFSIGADGVGFVHSCGNRVSHGVAYRVDARVNHSASISSLAEVSQGVVQVTAICWTKSSISYATKKSASVICLPAKVDATKKFRVTAERTRLPRFPMILISRRRR